MGEQVVVEQMETQMQQPPAWLAGFGVGSALVALVLYVFCAYCIARIGKKMGMPMGSTFVWALIPIANIFLLLKMAGKPYWWFILMLIPIVNLVIAIIMWMAISEKLGHPNWWGVCIALVPVLNIILFLMLAFEKPKTATA